MPVVPTPNALAALVAQEGGRSDGPTVVRCEEPPRDGSAVPLPSELAEPVREALARNGVTALWRHQRAAWEAARRGHVVVATGTASGKSLAFNLPVLDVLAKDPSARALYLYPSKALAQDQARKLAELQLPFLRPAIYDGDTPHTERQAIRRQANLILTNPDMLHLGILPNHARWAGLLRNLAAVVVDESHVYRGVFGSHVALVIRRLRRIAERYGTRPRFLLASATIANPGAHASTLTGEPVHVVSDDGAPSAGRTIVLWNPPLIDEKLGLRASPLVEAARLLAQLIVAGVRSICFLNSRRGVELVHRFTVDRLRSDGNSRLAAQVLPYRAGYTPYQRREIERKLVSGELRAIVATSALELGIDIGHLDAALCVTFPGTVASLRQMWGRAGRRRPGLAVFVAGEDALDQFFCRHPEDFLQRPVESAIVDPESEEIQLAHLWCAAHELPLTTADETFFGTSFQQRLRRLVRIGALREHGGRYLNRSAAFPAERVPLRSASAENLTIVDRESGEVLGTVERARALTLVHPGAVYMHLGVQYEVCELDLDAGRAIVEPFRGDWYTRPRHDTDVTVEAVRARQELAEGVVLSFGVISVRQTLLAYQRKRLRDHEPLDLVPLDLPPQDFVTQAFWWELLSWDRLGLSEEELPGGLHAAEHAQIAVLPLLAMCDRWDIGGLSTARHGQTGVPTVFVYDGHPGGVGIARVGFERFGRLCEDALRIVQECRCEGGCPSCIQSPKCGNLNEPLSKAGACTLLGALRDEFARAIKLSARVDG
ncbi:DEAD/DEAH box helicase [Thermoleophilum album]|uniref:DEAD/DEAH box helicase n=1 Tax=Thermoleophilum album TaxID=29539 RepID=UPI001C409347|nr:DEAD/DEAH box helicase [Thermoleophilum album]